MFENLKKKFSSFIGSISKKEEEKAEEQAIVEAKEEIKEIESQPQMQQQAPVQEEKAHEPVREPATQTIAPKEEHRVLPKPQLAEGLMPEAKQAELKAGQKQETPRQAQPPPKVTMGTRLKGIFMREVKISESDVDPFLEQLKTSLLESDVNYNASEKILGEIRKELISKPIGSRDIGGEITGIIRSSILSTLSKGVSKNLLERANEKRQSGELPFRILFTGPNGAGKTTTIAKVANMLMKNGFSCVISASDTFRAAAIEQTVHHANRLGVEVVKGKYGADPASIAFDAVAHAKAAGINVVLIDSAGRQETNKSLMEEMKKMVRVARPDMKIFIGESITGNALLEQVSQFNEAIGLDGVILTKLDADAKGGNTLSILSGASVPILYFGVGEKYEDLVPYDPNFIINNIVPN